MLIHIQSRKNKRCHYLVLFFGKTLLVFLLKSQIKGLLAGNSETVARRCPVKMLFLKISQNSQENTCAGVSF